MANEPVFFTLDADGADIPENAIIEKSDTMEDALTRARECYAGSDFEVTGMEEGRFGDCWIKVYAYRISGERLEEDIDDSLECRCMTRDDVRLSYPGSNPGGAEVWITPRADVYVPVLEPIED